MRERVLLPLENLYVKVRPLNYFLLLPRFRVFLNKDRIWKILLCLSRGIFATTILYMPNLLVLHPACGIYKPPLHF